MSIATVQEGLESLRETVRATGETHCLVYTGHGVIEVKREKDSRGYAVLEKLKPVLYSPLREQHTTNNYSKEKTM